MIEYNPWIDENDSDPMVDAPRIYDCRYCMDQGCFRCTDLEAQAIADEHGATGDPRRCPIHPNVQTSSADGFFDGVCGECEYMAEHGAELWDMDPANPHRKQCGPAPTRIVSAYPGAVFAGRYAKCSDVGNEYDDIPF